MNLAASIGKKKLRIGKFSAVKIRRMIATAGIALGVVAGGSLAAPAPQADAYTYNWGAIAWDWNGNTAAVIDRASSQGAVNAVVRRCGRHCGYFSFYNSCGAVAYTHNLSHVGRSWGYKTASGARARALRQLPRRGYVAAWACTTRPA